MGFWTRAVDRSNTCFLKNLRFLLFSTKRQQQNLVARKRIQFQSITTLSMQLGGNQTYPTNGFEEISSQWRMTNLFKKNQKFPFPSIKTGRWRFFVKKYQSVLIKGIVPHRLMQKQQHFRVSCTDRTQKYTLCLLKNQKNEVFSQTARQKMKSEKMEWKQGFVKDFSNKRENFRLRPWKKK